MGTAIVPSSAAPHEDRVLERVPYRLWYCPEFPVYRLGGKLDKDPQQNPWLQGLYDDLEESGALRNPVIVWNHHENRKRGKQPSWLLRAGSNRIWCVEQLGWATVPAVVSTESGNCPETRCTRIWPRQIEGHFTDGGKIWCNDVGFGLLAAKKPEVTYADNISTLLQKTDTHGRTKIIAPYGRP